MQGAKAYLEILGTHSEETCPSVMVTTNDTNRILFNFGEGLIRSTTEHNIKTTRANHLFVSHLTSHSISEFTNYFLRSHLTGTRATHICGPPNMANFIYSIRFFFNRGNHTIHLKECDGGERIATGNDGPEVEVISIQSILPSRDVSILPKKIPPSEGKQPDVIPELIHSIRGKRVSLIDFLDFIKKRGGLIDGYRHLDRAMQEEFFKRFPHPDGGEIPPDYFGEITSNNRNPDASHLYVASRHFRMDLHSSRVSSESEDSRNSRFQKRSDLFVTEPVFGPIKSLLHTIPALSSTYHVLSYLVRTPTIKGTFDAKKAVSLGVPRGPAFGILQKGGSFVTPDGKEIKSEDVMSPSRPGPIFAVVTCPNDSMMSDFVNHPTWANLQTNGESVSCMVHYSPRDVVDTPIYKSFLSSFGPQCQHIFIGKGMSRQHPVYIKSMTQTCILNTLCHQWVPLPYLDDFTPSLPDGLPKKSIQGDHFMKFLGVPLEKMGIFTNDCLPRFDVSQIQSELSKTEKSEIFEKSEKSDIVHPSEFSNTDLEIVFFGTGCSAASSLRNETAIYLDFFEKGGMMMDVGNGTYGQMFRKYGPNKINEVLCKLKVIWISHTHADHIQGIARLMHMRHMAKMEEGQEEDKILVIGPHTLYDVLAEHQASTACTCKHKEGLHAEFLFDFVDSFDLRTPSTLLQDYFGFSSVFSVPVLHAFMTHAIVMQHLEGWSVVFSGDTAYCQKLIDSIHSPTILIHEASFEDALIDKAASKAHCTTSQAIETGEKMNAKCTLLTHFSQRYRNLTMETQLHNVAGAYDFMSVNLADCKFVSEYGRRFAALGKITSLDGGEEDEYIDVE